ncbi:MAG: HK97 family phage prohead protease [Actinomyces urogenitalis]|uniref:HK97 family phage prohead protease n=1 Tax=Actinomyces urogenitalis TaxID=103621 RepID=UPI0039934D0D
MTMQRRDITVHLTTRAAETGGHVIEGIAVPLMEPTTIIPGYREQIAAGAVDLEAQPALFYRHSEPIGVITRLWEDADALKFEAHVSDTALGRDAYTLAHDGAIRSASIGFYEREWSDEVTDDGEQLRTQTRIDLREISLVPVPAYEGAQITNVRNHHDHTTTIEEPHMDTTATDTLERAITETTGQIDLLTRRVSLLEDTPAQPAAPTIEHRSGGELLRAAIDGDDAARAALAPLVGRAPGNTTSSDARYEEPTFITDLTRIIQVLSPLSSLFATGTLPSEGNTLEFARLKTNTTTVARQANEGDALPLGTVSIETDATTKIGTYGGATTLSRQAIERTRTNILDLQLRALTMAAAKAQADAFSAFYKGVVKSQASRAITTTKTAAALDWKSLLHMLLDARAAYRDVALPLDGLIVDRPTFEAIAGMTDTTGRPILAPTGTTPVNNVGTLNASSDLAAADLHGLTIKCDDISGALDGAVGAFYSHDALRTYTSGTVSLQDQSVLDLTAAFSIYFYAAFADEIPTGIVPLKTAAA